MASTASGWPTDDRFSSTRALEAMDKRAQSNTPWWAVDLSSDNDDDSQELGRKGNGQDGGMDRSDPIGTSAVGASTQLATALSTGALNLTPGYLVGMLIAGTHSPVAVASAVVAILGAVYLPSILMEGISSVMWTSNSTSGD
uniref:Uncharacterized protein n=1 Tax=Craspedostauros australis TaxID=1486917 RepID=A0A7R9WTH7_9STRA